MNGFLFFFFSFINSVLFAMCVIDLTLTCRIASKGEWSVTFWLLKDKDGLISKESIRDMFDGSIFKKVEMRKSKSQ